MSSAREEILRRITKAKGASIPDKAAAEYAGIERAYQQAALLSHDEVLEVFIDRLHDYDATVQRVTDAGVADAMEQTLQRRGVSRVLVPEGLPSHWLRGAEFVVDAGFSPLELDAFQAVVTTATMGIAETGTIVLQNAAGQGRRAVTLVPDYHLCVLRADSVVETVVEAIRALEPTKHLPTTFFSGPSATADIEMTRIKGVHGPRFVDVLLVE